MNILDHIEIAVGNAETSRRFYEIALAPLGIVRVLTIEPTDTRTGGTRHGFGVDGYPCLLYTSPSPRDLSTSRMPSSA